MLRRFATLLTVVALFVTSLAPLNVFASTATRKSRPVNGERKLAPELDSAKSGTIRVIVQTKGRPTAAQDNAINAKGGSRRKSFDSLDALVADVPATALAELAARSDVLYVSPDRRVRAQTNVQTNVTREAVGADLVQQVAVETGRFDGNAESPGITGVAESPGFTGKGVGIAVIDSGISANHPDFLKNGKSRVVASVNFTNGAATTRANGILVDDGILVGDGVVLADGDRDGHGTGVAGVAAGSGAGSSGYAGNYAGIAPGAHLIDLKALDENGAGTTSAVLDAINWAITNQKKYKIGVINMSLGTPVRESFRTDPLSNAIARATQRGIVVVCSAGNNGRSEEITGYDASGDPIYRLVYGAINSPGNSPYAITVGATDTHGTVRRSDDTLAQFSSKGPTQFDHLAKPDLVAPGRRVVAPMSQDNPATARDYADRIVAPTSANAPRNLYFLYSGTSFAAPVVSGVVALMLEANRSLTPLLTKTVLVRTAQALQAPQWVSKTQSFISQGAGQVNAALAVSMARAIVPNADKLKAGDHLFRPGVTLKTLTQSVQIGGETVKASDRVLYTSGVVFANSPVLTNGIMLSDGIYLSDGIMLSDGIVVGSGILVDDGVMCGDGIVVGSGIMLSDGIVVGSGIMLSDGVVMGDGIVLTDGFLLANAILLTDGHLLSDGIMLSDGVVMGDGFLLANGIVMTDGILLSEGIMLSDGILLSEGVVMGDGAVLSDGVMCSDGVVMGDGILIHDGIVLSDGIVVASGIMLSDGVTVADGVMVADGLVVSSGIMVAD
jgi:serine protease AprX